MATEDQSLDSYGELAERIIQSRISPQQPANAVTECEDCGDEINPARKKAIPSTKRCIDCETQAGKRR